jgi:hypothetical protein
LGSSTATSSRCFVETHSAEGRVASVVARGSRSLLIYLRELGMVGPERGDVVTPLGGADRGVPAVACGERGPASLTVARYVALATRFLGERVSTADELGVMDLSGEQVTAFRLRECERLSIDSAKGKVGELRSLLRFLFVHDRLPPRHAPATAPLHPPTDRHAALGA